MSPANSGKPSGRKAAAPKARGGAVARGVPARRGAAAGGGGGRGGAGGGRGAPGSGGGRGGTGAAAGARGGNRGGARGNEEVAPKWNQTPSGLGGEQIEGRHAVRELLTAEKRKVKEVWIASGVDESDIIDDIVDMCRERRITLHEVSRVRLEAAAKSDNPQGVLAYANALPNQILEDMCETKDGVKPFLLALDGVTDPHNVGSLIRTGECAGITGVVLPRHRSAHVTPTVAKVSAGAVEHLPMSLVPGLPAALATVKAKGVWTVGLDMDGDVDISELAVADKPIMLVMGAEGTGLARLTRERCDIVARIPQYGSVASLNVAAAGAIACFEIAKCRAKATD